MDMIQYDDFRKVDMRVGRILSVEDFPEARTPAWKLMIDFGPEIGTKKSSAQIVARYRKEDLIGRQVVCVINFPPKQIGPFRSECLTMGVDDAQGRVTLLGFPEGEVPVGGRVY